MHTVLVLLGMLGIVAAVGLFLSLFDIEEK